MSDETSARSERRIWATVPFRGPVGSKRRLAPLLDVAERERLSLAMLADVLDVLLGAEWIERVLLLTPSRDGIEVPEHPRLLVVDEPKAVSDTGEAGGLNVALRHAQQMAQAGGAQSLLVLPADLPLLATADLDALHGCCTAASLVIVPDRATEGTNALLLTPPTALEPSFGEGSFARHLRLAHEAGLSVCLLKRGGLELDLDTPADVAALLADDAPGRAAVLLRELGVARRLERLAPAQARSTTI